MELVIENITKAYIDKKKKETIALENINLTIQNEEFVAIVGPSGCGKSTLLNIIAGLIPATSGEVYFDGIEGARKPLTSVVFQETGLFPWRTVEDNIKFGLEHLKLPQDEIENRVQHYTKMVWLRGLRSILSTSIIRRYEAKSWDCESISCATRFIVNG